MNKWIAKVARFLREEDGPTAVEYAVMLAFIITVCITSVTAVGQSTNRSFSNTNLNASLGS
jgi:pilus assembly protein Flp/PilA